MKQYSDSEIREAFERSNVQIQRCEHCKKLYVVMKSGSRFCSTNCRVSNHRFWKTRRYFSEIVSKKLKTLPNFQSYTLQTGFKVDNKEQFEIGLNGTQKVFKGNAKEVLAQIDDYLICYKKGDLSKFYN